MSLLLNLILFYLGLLLFYYPFGMVFQAAVGFLSVYYVWEGLQKQPLAAVPFSFGLVFAVATAEVNHRGGIQEWYRPYGTPIMLLIWWTLSSMATEAVQDWLVRMALAALRMVLAPFKYLFVTIPVALVTRLLRFVVRGALLAFWEGVVVPSVVMPVSNAYRRRAVPAIKAYLDGAFADQADEENRWMTLLRAGLDQILLLNVEGDEYTDNVSGEDDINANEQEGDRVDGLNGDDEILEGRNDAEEEVAEEEEEPADVMEGNIEILEGRNDAEELIAEEEEEPAGAVEGNNEILPRRNDAEELVAEEEEERRGAVVGNNEILEGRNDAEELVAEEVEEVAVEADTENEREPAAGLAGLVPQYRFDISRFNRQAVYYSDSDDDDDSSAASGNVSVADSVQGSLYSNHNNRVAAPWNASLPAQVPAGFSDYSGADVAGRAEAFPSNQGSPRNRIINNNHQPVSPRLGSFAPDPSANSNNNAAAAAAAMNQASTAPTRILPARGDVSIGNTGNNNNNGEDDRTLRQPQFRPPSFVVPERGSDGVILDKDGLKVAAAAAAAVDDKTSSRKRKARPAATPKSKSSKATAIRKAAPAKEEVVQVDGATQDPPSKRQRLSSHPKDQPSVQVSESSSDDDAAGAAAVLVASPTPKASLADARALAKQSYLAQNRQQGVPVFSSPPVPKKSAKKAPAGKKAPAPIKASKPAAKVAKPSKKQAPATKQAPAAKRPPKAAVEGEVLDQRKLAAQQKRGARASRRK